MPRKPTPSIQRAHTLSTPKGITVFISYSRKDNTWANRIQQALEDNEIIVWRDKSSLIAGWDINDSLSDALNKVTYVIVLLSKYSSSSSWVEKELNAVIRREVKDCRQILIPIKLDKSPPPRSLEDRHYLDFTSLLPEDAINDLLKHLHTLVSDNADIACDQQLRESRTTNGALFIGIDVGTTKIATAVISLSQNSFVIEYEKKVRHSAIGAEKETSLLDKILSQIHEVRKAKRLCPEDISGIGIGLPGQVHQDCGWLIFAPGLEQRNVDIVAGLTSKMPNVNIFVDNDVKCATLAEHRFGRGQKFRNFICVFVGTGVGAGIVIEGHLHRGNNSAAGEIGHMRIDMAEHALLCKCGRKGCLEEYASARAITRMARERINGLNAANEVTPEIFMGCLRRGDQDATSIATEFARNLSIGLGNAVDILNPEAVFLGGGIIEALMDFDFFRNALKIGFENNVLSIVKDTPILEASYGNKSGMIGAAILAESKVMEGR